MHLVENLLGFFRPKTHFKNSGGEGEDEEEEDGKAGTALNLSQLELSKSACIFRA